MRATSPRRMKSLDVEHEPVQPDPMINDGRAGTVGIVAAALATALIVILVLHALTQPTPQASTGAVAFAPPAATAPQTAPGGTTGNTGPGTTGQGTTTNQGRPLPTEQDPIEQNTRP